MIKHFIKMVMVSSTIVRDARKPIGVFVLHDGSKAMTRHVCATSMKRIRICVVDDDDEKQGKENSSKNFPGFHDCVIIKKIDAYCPSSILPDFFSQLAANAKNEKDNFDDDNDQLEDLDNHPTERTGRKTAQKSNP